MRPVAVVFVAPEADLFSGVSQVAEPTGVKTFITHPAVKAFDVTVLRWFSRLYVYELDLLFFTPAQEMTARQLRPVVTTNALRNPALLDDLLKHASRCWLDKLVSVSRARHSRVNASTTARMRTPRPVASESDTKSSAHS